ncbi:MAG: helix-turn-helix transcriptional regulator [Methanomassiliicoccus sp.]|nr:helix-turn-helix transcriptional regulator [Methanomassiliicoccus sp.]
MRISADQEELCILEAIRTANAHREELAEALVDNSVLTIMAATARRDLTVREISTVTGIPLATCYKLVEKMGEIGLLAETGKVRTSTRGKASMFSSSMKNFSVDVSNGTLDVNISWKNGQTMNVVRDVCSTIVSGEIVSSVEAEGLTTR